MYLDDPADEVIDIRSVPGQLTLIHVLPETCTLRLTDQLGLLQLPEILRVELGVFGSAQLRQAALQDLSCDVTLREMNTADQVSIVLIYSCQFNSHSFMQKHLLNERFAFIVDGLFSVPRRVQVHEI